MLNSFLNEKNLNILREILYNELNLNYDTQKNNELKLQVNMIFNNNINFFIKNANMNNKLLELNKIFLKQTIKAINTLIPNIKQNNIKKITINEAINFPHKIEDIQNAKRELFNDELNLKITDFENSYKNKKPETIDFSDKYENKKIINMDELMSAFISQRNNDVPEIMLDVKEKNKNDEDDENNKDNENTKNNQFIEGNKKNNKKVFFNLSEDDENNMNQNMNIIINEKKTLYEEQISIPLPENVQQLEIKKTETKQNDSIQTQTQPNVVPIIEIIKKMNEMDKKIDRLIKIIEDKILK